MPAEPAAGIAREVTDISRLPLVRLLQLASPTLPIGAYSYSQGLEWAVEAGEIRDAAGAQTWIGDVMEWVVAPGDAAACWRLLEAARDGDWPRLAKWNSWFRATRETSELRAETEQTGGSLVKLLHDLGLLDGSVAEAMPALAPVTQPAAYALAAQAFAVPVGDALTAYVWSWLENQVLAAVKLVPLGQVAGQRMLASLSRRVAHVVESATTVADDALSTLAPGFALACARHETQYSRLFRS